MSSAAPARTLPQWLSTATQIAAPVTLVSTLLFYFGYVYTKSQYAYFGVDVDTIGLTPRDYVMRSPAAAARPPARPRGALRRGRRPARAARGRGG